jgi:DNA-binding protein HU-beta
VAQEGQEQVNKQDLVNAVAERSGLTKKDAEKAVNATIEVIEGALAKG